MPLIATSRPLTPVKLGVGCWMAVPETAPAELIWVVATRETLQQLDPSELPDNHVAVFEKHRAKIEDAASAKFDSEGLDPEDGYEGRRVLMVRSTPTTARLRQELAAGIAPRCHWRGAAGVRLYVPPFTGAHS
jgi:Protein of unknown function (DUF1488)